jgi:hypothetical protein
MRRTAFLFVLILSVVAASSSLANAGTQDPTKAGAAWLRALFATGSPNDAQAALPLAAPNSPAHAYTVHQIGVMKAQAGSGGGTSNNSVKTKGRNVALCQRTLSGNQCVTFTRFKIDKQGRVENFSQIRGGKPQRLDPPVLETGQSGNAFGVTFNLVSYFRARDGLFVILDATNGGNGARTVESYQASYQPPTGSAVQSGSSTGLNGDIQPGVTATLALVFPGEPAPGGTVSIPMLSGPPDYSNGNATIPLG